MMHQAPATEAELYRGVRCIDCGRTMGRGSGPQMTCPTCARSYSVHEGILLALGELSGNNRIAQEFYNGPRFERFRFWENLFLLYAGGLSLRGGIAGTLPAAKGARMQILRHLPPLEEGDLLEVGIGDGDNVRLLPERVHVTGIDIALRRLTACRQRYKDRSVTLALAEAEHIPLESRSFDAVLCVGGFNFFSDPAAALAEMVRVTRPAGRIVVADEIPDFFRYGWGHRIRIPALDRWLMKHWFGAEFRDMVLENELDNELDLDRLAGEALDRPRIHRIWRGYGYCIVGSPP